MLYSECNFVCFITYLRCSFYPSNLLKENAGYNEKYFGLWVQNAKDVT